VLQGRSILERMERHHAVVVVGRGDEDCERAVRGCGQGVGRMRDQGQHADGLPPPDQLVSIARCENKEKEKEEGGGGMERIAIAVKRAYRRGTGRSPAA